MFFTDPCCERCSTRERRAVGRAGGLSQHRAVAGPPPRNALHTGGAAAATGRSAHQCDLAHNDGPARSYCWVAHRFLTGRRLRGQWRRRRRPVMQFSSFKLTLVAREASCMHRRRLPRAALEIGVPIYRVLSGPGTVIYVFAAGDDQEAEMYARHLSEHSRPRPPPRGSSCLLMQGLVDDRWRPVCTWRP